MIQRLTDEKTYPEGHLLAGDFFFFRLTNWITREDQYEAGMKAFPKDKAIVSKAPGGAVRQPDRPEIATPTTCWPKS